MKYLACQKVCRQEEAETGEATAEAAEAEAAAAGEERSCRMLTIGDCELRSLLIRSYLGQGLT